MAIADVTPTIVGALSCQRDSYQQTLETKVVRCEEYIPPRGNPQQSRAKSKQVTDLSKANDNSDAATQKTWMIEFADSVLFPEGGGQHTDHGFVTPIGVKGMSAIPIENIQRHGLRCVHFSQTPLEVGTRVRQTVYYARRWDLMQQHTGQHLLSAIMDGMDLPTLGWSMGRPGEMNYVELPRKPTDVEMAGIQQECNAVIRENLPVTVETPEAKGSASLPADYDGEKGVVRFVKIGDLDYNACCGTHLKQTSHIGLVLLHHTQSIRGTNCRLFFTAGDRAINMATESINGLRNIAISLSSGAAPTEVAAKIQGLREQASDARKREKRLLAEIARFEAEQIKDTLQCASSAFSHRPDDGLDFINLVLVELKETLKGNGVVLLCTGDVKTSGSLVITGKVELVEKLSAKIKGIVETVKGGGRGEKWQGKVTEWQKGEVEALRTAVEEL
ncbi:ThrRS/AlaRS common domain-containing protein [Didymella exigua CBS 183.55]|uniref:ThrRS/AlaRS common domain-containing protein n=1 Tax=Didymella exigua CBS 183.55 TaxID=1150837 RepID=A0A6A5RZV3_9PLEO|nr:ThrRS/AlaRS common domain-containing protein [Didymella exigua CBS 183.55]KAF1933995.1 ThrRS/AlaRS common domain-containing protein [Didymella exigua CBS 183.55]